MTDDSRSADRPECRAAARELLGFYLNGSLEQDEEETVRAHLDVCPMCSAEIDELSTVAAAIEAHGTGAATDHFRTPRALGLAAAVAVLLSAMLYVSYLRHGGSRPVEMAGTGELHVDLSVGALRGEEGVPSLTLTPAARNVIVSFIPPARAGARYRVVVLDPGGRAVIDDAPLGDLDSMGRASVVLPASKLRFPGRYQVVLQPEGSEGGAPASMYPFEVRRSP
jgi:putative zinc finger protein